MDTHVQDAGDGYDAMLLHGIYVEPSLQRRGIGSQLLEYAADLARGSDADGLIVKAQKDAEDFFKSRGMKKLHTHDSRRDFENRYWMPVP